MMYKKLNWMLAAILAICGTAHASAQGQVDYESKHEVGITIGGASNSSIIDDFEDATLIDISAGKLKYTHTKRIGTVSMEYFYRVRPAIAVGGIFAYARQKRDVELNSVKEGNCTMNYFTLMPAIKFDWLRRQHYGLYSKVAAGATMRYEKLNMDEGKDVKDDTFSDVFFNWQVSLIGIEGGSQSLRAFAELGMGEQGIGLVGLRYRF